MLLLNVQTAQTGQRTPLLCLDQEEIQHLRNELTLVKKSSTALLLERDRLSAGLSWEASFQHLKSSSFAEGTQAIERESKLEEQLRNEREKRLSAVKAEQLSKHESTLLATQLQEQEQTQQCLQDELQKREMSCDFFNGLSFSPRLWPFGD